MKNVRAELAAQANDSREFLNELRAAVRRDLADSEGFGSRVPIHYIKAAVLGTWFAVSYLLMLSADSWVSLVLAGVAVGVALAALAFNVQHDGGHGAFSERAATNQAASRVLDFLGMSSYLWRWKHNVLHHANPNVDGLDEDVDASPLFRLHPAQRLRPWHRFQHIYCWALYPFVTLRWALFSDLHDVVTGRIGGFAFPPMSVRDIRIFWLSKAQFIGWAFIIPAAAHGLAIAAVFFLVFETAGGFIAAVCFQLAHAVEEAEHLTQDAAARLTWEERQLVATVDFRVPALVEWFLGGLNNQSVHHLFPGVSHVHYPRIARILKESAERHGLLYKSGPSLSHQVGSHFRWMRRLGTPAT